MSDNRHADPDWRKFERLVSRIEKDAAPLGWTVTSPDKVLDTVTGTMREVDATIRPGPNEKPFLVTIECRDRRRSEDVTWIEQLATKKSAIGADKTIAVSASGFSESALKAASHYGLQLKRMKDVSVSDINTMLKLDLVLFTHRRAQLAGVAFRWYHDGEWTMPDVSHPDYVLPHYTDPLRPIFTNNETGETWSLSDLYERLQREVNTHAGLIKFMPPQSRMGCFAYPGNVTVETPDGVMTLGDVFYQVLVWLETEEVSLEDAKKVEYVGEGAEPIQRVEFTSMDTTEGEKRFSLQAPKGATDLRYLKSSITWPYEGPQNR